MTTYSHFTSRRSFVKGMALSLTATALGVVSISGKDDTIEPESNGDKEYKVFTSGKIGSLQLKNRLIRAATLENAGKDGVPAESYLQIIQRLVSGGAGLIITGGMAAVSPALSETQIKISDDSYIPGIAKIAEAVHTRDNTCKIVAQIVHVDNSTSPSGIDWNGNLNGIYTIDQIKNIIKGFSEAVARTKTAGFDGAELNAHYIFFLSTFISAQTNKRNDEYGGNLENRIRIVREILHQARVKVGNDYPVLIKINCDDSFSLTGKSESGTNIDNFPLLAKEIEKAGFDAIELSGNTMLRKDINKASYFAEYAKNLNLGIPVILTGGNRSLDIVEDIFREGKIDFFGFARPFVREPDLPNRWQAGSGNGLSKCIFCNMCTSTSPLRCVQESE